VGHRGACYDSETGGHCAIGAVARAVYPKAKNSAISDLAYVNTSDDAYLAETGRRKDPRHVAAIEVLARTITRKKNLSGDPLEAVYSFNDNFESGVDKDFDWETDRYVTTVNEKVRLKSAKKVVAKMRRAAARYRQENAA
jgi:hypothetical protein